MAVGLGFPGRGGTWFRAQSTTLHLLGSALGGAAAGVLLASIGGAASLNDHRVIVVGTATALALFFSLRRRPAKLGLQVQVPRTWRYTMLPQVRYMLWGILLGSGIATLIPYPIYLVLFGAELTVGVPVAAAAGALFGVARELPVVIPLVLRYREDETFGLFGRLHPAVRRLNLGLTAAIGILLVLATLT
jgi:hypothetical protein